MPLPMTVPSARLAQPGELADVGVEREYVAPAASKASRK